MMIVGARNGIGAFVIPMSEDFGWTRVTVSIAAFLGIFINGLTQPFLGNAFDRFGGRKVIVLSLVLLGLGTLALSLTFHILFLIILFGLVSGTAYSGASPSVISALLARWFKRRRATALGMNGAGAALGGLVLIPLAIFIIEVGNWRLAWAALGLIVLLVAVPLVYLTIHDGPEKLGLRPDGEPEPPNEASKQKPEGPTGPLVTERWLDSLRSWPIWQMTTAYVVDGISTSVLLVHFIPYADERGASPATAALMFGLMMAVSIVGSTSTGMVSDRMGRKTLLTLVYVVRGCGYAAMLLVPGSFGLWVSVAAIGFSWNAAASLTTTLIADIYGLSALGAIAGMAYSIRQFGGAFGVLLAGYLFDITGSYALPFAIKGILILPAILAVYTVNEERYSTRYQETPEVPPLASSSSGN